ncbi:hypothetical protein AB4305_01090 [Nocardia sp. 2YAB30]|uniref:hypothetical protein n=1 Tax=unclassified Nocardia TaxID=2637762 RepID=UPI003F9D3719
MTGHAEFVHTPRAIAVRGNLDWWASRDPANCPALENRWIRPYQGVAFPVDIVNVFSPPDLAKYLREMADHAAIDEYAYDPDEYVDVDEYIDDWGCLDVVAGGWKVTLKIAEPDQVSHDSVAMPYRSGGVIPPQEPVPDRHPCWVHCTIDSFAENAAEVRKAVLAVMPEDTAPNSPAPDPAPPRNSQRRPATLRTPGKGPLWPYEDLAEHLDSAEAVQVSATAIDDTWTSTRCDCIVTHDRYAAGTLTDKSSGRAEFVAMPQTIALRGNESWWARGSLENTRTMANEWIRSPEGAGFDLDIADTFDPARLADQFRLLCTCAVVERKPGEDGFGDLCDQIERTGNIRAHAGSWTVFHYADRPGEPWKGWVLAPIRSSKLVPPGEHVPELHRGWIVFHIENVAADAAATRTAATGVLEEWHGL